MLEKVFDYFQVYIYAYPLAMSIVWCVTSLYFYFRRERHFITQNPYDDLKPEGISVIIPAHNESLHIGETIESVLGSNYPVFEIIIVDDCSTDNTLEIIRGYAEKYDNVRTIHFEQNQGKPTGLNFAALASQYRLLMVLDADVLIDPDAMAYMARHFQYGPRVGAVTGNPRVRNRSILLEKIQVAEYSSIIGTVKRSQRILGKIFTVSGAIVCFRKEAVFDVGIWNTDMITDDINISWKLEKRFWDVRYETMAMSWTVVPDKLRMLWRQRLRWAQGGCEVLIRHYNVWKDIRQRRFWPVYVEYFFSTMWSYSFILYTTLGLISLFFPIAGIQFRWMSGWTGFLVTVICMVQFALSTFYDSAYENKMFKYMFYVIWYAIIYWLISAGTVFFGLIKAFIANRKKNYVATWTSPERTK